MNSLKSFSQLNMERKAVFSHKRMIINITEGSYFLNVIENQSFLVIAIFYYESIF